MRKVLAAVFSGFIVVEGTGYHHVEVSLRDVNRIVCPVPIESVVFSKDKDVQVEVQGRNAYVKFLSPSKEPRELYVECGGKVFSLILVPKKIRARTVVLRLPEEDLQAARKFEDEAYTRTIEKIIAYVYKEVPPPGWTVEVKEKPYKRFKEGSLTLHKVFKGASFVVFELSFKADEDFYLHPAALVPYFKNVVAVGIVQPRLRKGETTRVFVVVRRKDA